MKDHDTDNDFLDGVYSHSAKEVPPLALDQAILKQARDNVAKTKFLPRRQWQQIFSVAAVLVLSVYIVLDMGEQSLKIDDFSLMEEGLQVEQPKAKKVKSAPVFESADVFDDLDNSSVRKEQSLEINSFQREKRVEKRAEEIVEERVEKPFAVEAKQSVSAQAVSSQMSADKDVIIPAEKMVSEIERLIAEGELVDARNMYEKFSDAYPEYPLPNRIVKALK